MQSLMLIGIGTGNPDHLTGQAAAAMRQADLILIPRKGADKSDLAELRLQICRTVLGDSGPAIAEFDLPVRDTGGDYVDGVTLWHDAIAAAWQQAVAAHLPDAATVALLIWGDPSLYDSSLRIAARLKPAPKIRVIPGITSLQALTAAHAIALNEIGAPVLVTTGRRLRDQGLPDDVDTAAIMLDGQCSFQSLNAGEYDIWWGAYLGMAEEVLIAGPLDQVSAQILDTRARERLRHGWIMDIYLLRRRAGAHPD